MLPPVGSPAERPGATRLPEVQVAVLEPATAGYMTLSKIRRSLYRSASLLGDAQAARSPSTAIRRVARKTAWRSFGRLMRRVG